MSVQRVIIVAGGDLPHPSRLAALIAKDDFVIAVNGGTRHAAALGISPDLVMGDLDSLMPEELASLKKTASRLERYRPEKDKSDLELALDRAVSLEPEELIVLGALGGERTDHLFANLLLLALPMRSGIPARLLSADEEVRLISSSASFKGRPGDYLSLFSLTGESSGITTAGLKFPLQDEKLHFSSSRGLSNEFCAGEAFVSLKEGLLLAIKTSRQVITG